MLDTNQVRRQNKKELPRDVEGSLQMESEFRRKGDNRVRYRSHRVISMGHFLPTCLQGRAGVCVCVGGGGGGGGSALCSIPCIFVFGRETRHIHSTGAHAQILSKNKNKTYKTTVAIQDLARRLPPVS